MNKRNTLNSLVCAVGLATMSSALFVDSAQAFTINFGSGSQSSNDPKTGAAAFADFNFIQDGTNVKLNLTVKNTTGSTSFGAGATESNLTGFGFDLASGVSVVNKELGSKLDTYLTNSEFQPFGNLGLVFADNANLKGGQPDGLLEGGSNTMSLLLGSNLDAKTVENAFYNGFKNGTLDVGVRFQAVNAGAGSDKLLGGTFSAPPNDNPGAAVPEPTTVAGWLLAGGVLGKIKQMKGKKQEK